MRREYRGKPKPKSPSHLKGGKEKGEVGIVLEEILIKAGSQHHQPKYELKR
jgi:hypothetical protein